MIETYRMNTIHYRPEETILSPEETRFEVEVKITDMKHLYEKNGYGEFIFEFNPATPHDWYILEDAVDSAIRMVEQRKPDWSRKVAAQKCMNRKGFYNCNQLFQPKVNLSEEQIQWCQNPDASLTVAPER